ncbi:junctional cadherin 5-associated protein [Tamandua tetradactyla]|uniref:junctional cadherin 5-associated protein n=1 Tax=Tamandua tetradactyla TaxID=48850 RepID=UPI00405491A9
MYSVEDLLISHGYKVSRPHPAPHEDGHEQHLRGRTRPRAGQGVVNGYETGPGERAQGKKSLGQGHVGASESSRGTPRGHRELPSSAAWQASEMGFYDQAPFLRPSQSRSGDDRAWRRGQEPGSFLGPGAREDLVDRGVVQAHGLPVHLREGPREVGERTENVIKKAILEEELRMSSPARWQNVSLESWNRPRKLGRQMSDGDGEKLFQDLYPYIQGEHVLNSHNKGKSQSLPRVLSPESLSCVEIPIPLNDGHLSGVPKTPFYPPNCVPNLESTRNPEKGGSFVPLPRPKFGRPLKPPSYESHRQPRGGVESGEGQDGQHTDLHVNYLTKTSDPRHDLWVSDPGLEPPVYVPPPSYRSPSQHITNPYLEDAVPRQQPPMEKSTSGLQLPCGSLGSRSEFGASPHSPAGHSPQPHPAIAYGSSVQYIPFGDPRIRHIKLAQPLGICEEANPYGQLYSCVPAAPQEPAAYGSGAFWMPVAGSRGAPATSDPSPPWLLGPLPRHGESDHGCVVRDPQADTKGSRHGHPEGRVSPPSLWGERTRETVTQLKTSETESQVKRRSKKKTNETIFCLVSIPVKSESHLPDIDTNNNNLKRSSDKQNGFDKSAALHEQSLLSMSSTDLELQALTGSMAGKTELQKHDPGETDDLGFIHLPGPQKPKLPGSGPGHQHRDQQTQTSFTEEPKSSQPQPGPQPGDSGDAVPTPSCLGSTISEAQKPPAFTPSDPKQRPGTRQLKGHMHLSLSSNSAFSRTAPCPNRAPVPGTCPGQPCLEAERPAADHTPKGEVVKGAAAGPCNSKQFFGQFLLKPVSRRPWDLISQLESFNKELQEEEESSSSGSGSEESEAGWQAENCTDSGPENSGLGASSQEVRVEQGTRTVVPEEPGFRSGRVKSKSESWSEEQKPGGPCAWPGSLGPQQAEGSRGGCGGLAGGSVVMEKRIQEVERRIDQLAVSPGPVKRMTAFRLSGTKPAPPFHPVEQRESQENQKVTSVFSSAVRSQGVTPWVTAGEEQGTGVPLSLADKGRGLSAPDLRAVGLNRGEELPPGELAHSLEKAGAVEIPPNESLQARAARILGIDVAVESLLPGSSGSRHDQPPAPDAGAPQPDLPGDSPSLGSACPEEPAGSRDAFYSRRKCGWTQSPLFVGGRDAEPPKGVDGALAGGPSPPELGDTRPPCRTTLFHLVEGSPERRPKGASRAIESLQEKLASPPQRAAPDRMMRMKEVSSVSRLRLLASRGGPAEAQNPVAQGGGCDPPQRGRRPDCDPPQRGQRPDCAPKGVVSRAENGCLTPQSGRRRVEQDFWCPDSYDPSRVERV